MRNSITMGFRIGLQLTNLFSDERSLSYIYIEETFKKIHDLESHIRDLFEVRGPFCLTNQKYLLPSSESILILQENDVITLVPIQSPFSFNKTLFTPVASEVSSAKSPEEVESVEKEAKKKKRKKNKEIQQDTSAIELVEEHAVPSASDSVFIDEAMITRDVGKAVKHMEEYISKQKKADEEEMEAMKSKALNALKDIFPTNINGVSDGRIKKRKRIRIRRSKKQVEYLQSDSESTITQNNKSLVLTNGKKNSSHIRFSPAADKPVTVIQNEMVTQKLDKTPRIVRAIQPEMLSCLNSPNGSVTDASISFNGNGFQKKTNGEMSQKYFDNIQGSQSVINADNIKNSQLQNVEHSLISVLKRLDTYKVETEMDLQDNDIIVFKMLKIGEDYTPIVSKHILGKVSSYNTEEQSVNLTILDGHEECIEPSGKFQLEEEFQEASTRDSIDVAWGQLLEPRIIH